MSGTLNTSNFTKVFDDNFANDSSLNTNLWPVHWGNADDFKFGNGALTITSYKSENWTNAGIIQADFAANNGEGYGLYSFTASANAGEGIGIALVLWPANNVWPGQELDLLESSDSTRKSGYATVHWKGSDGSNQYQSHYFSLDLTQKHTYAYDWEPGVLTYYIDGRQIFSTTAHVPVDFAHGGINESMSAEVTAAGSNPVSSSVSLHLYDISYSKPNAGGTTGGGGSTTDVVTVNEPSPLIAGNDTITGHETDPSQAIWLDWRTNGTPASNDAGWVKTTVDAQGNFSGAVNVDHPGTQSTMYYRINTGPAVKAWSATPVADPKITDNVGHTATLPVITSGSQIFSTASTGLAAPVTESLSGGVVTISTPTWGLDKVIALSDTGGGSYHIQNFSEVNAELGGAPNGSLVVEGASQASITLDDGNYTVRIQNDSSVVSQITSSDVNFSGSATTINFGTGNADIWGGKEADTFVFHAGDGLATIETFSALKGDVLDIDHTLQAVLTETQVSGGTLISFGDPNHGVLLHGVANLAPSSVHWI